jgi:SAM-dependent methyltransferase
MEIFRKSGPSWADAQPRLREWYQTGLGDAVLDTVSEKCDDMLSGIFGYQGLQVGQIAPHRELLASAGLHRRIVIDSYAETTSAQISGELEHLPISSNCVNLVFFPHSLEFCANPHGALREADRVLTADGHLLLLGFNPYSQFGLRRSFGRSVPWNGNTYSRARIQDWLSVLGYRIVTAETVFLRTPIDRPGFLRRTRYIEHTQRFFGFVGGVYLIHARKQSIPMTITRQSWMRPQGRLVTGAFAQRSTRSSVNRSTASPDKDRTE